MDGDGRWSWLSPLGGEPIRLTPENVIVTMSVRWLGGLVVRGRFMDVRGTIHVPVRDDDTAAVTVEIRADSVRTGISLRDRHLRGPLFLDAARHPVITFRGGDVTTYLAAAATATTRQTLSVNWRSDAALLSSMQELLRGAELGDERIVVRDVEAHHGESRLEGAGPAFRVRVVRR